MSKALLLVLAVCGVFTVVTGVAMVQDDATSTQRSRASKHWVDGTNQDDHLD